MATLDATQQRLLENAPDNPNSPKKAEPVAARPGLGFSKSTSGGGPPKPSLRETMMAQKKAALANKNMPARPGSAMSTFSPVRTVSSSSTVSDAPPVRARPEARSEASTVTHGGLSVAPMRPTKFRPAPRPEPHARPATAGPYSVRRPGHGPSNSDTNTSPSTRVTKVGTSSSSSNSPPKKPIARPNTSHSNHSHASQSNHASPARNTISKVVASPRASPPKPRLAATKAISSSPSKADEDFTMVVPTISGLQKPFQPPTDKKFDSSDDEDLVTPMKSMKVYEDPFSSTDDQTTPRPPLAPLVLEEVPINEDALNVARNSTDGSNDMNGSNGVTTMESTPSPKAPPMSPERFKQSSRLLESGITKIKAKALDVHGFRKLQGMIRDNKAAWSDDRFDALLLGLFEYLEAPLTTLSPEKVQDVKAQILATIKLMYKKDRDAFRPHVPQGLESILATRSSYDARSHIVSGLELLADELVTLAEPQQTTDIITAQLQNEKMTLEGCRTLSMGLHILKELLDVKTAFMPNDVEVKEMCKLAARCLESAESGVRMDAVSMCVSIHARVGENTFWNALGGVKDDPKSLITYYIVKRQREEAATR
jgi:CLIP-associating protein 1/2